MLENQIVTRQWISDPKMFYPGGRFAHGYDSWRHDRCYNFRLHWMFPQLAYEQVLIAYQAKTQGRLF